MAIVVINDDDEQAVLQTNGDAYINVSPSHTHPLTGT